MGRQPYGPAMMSPEEFKKDIISKINLLKSQVAELQNDVIAGRLPKKLEPLSELRTMYTLRNAIMQANWAISRFKKNLP